jgi:hypothetical protein
MSVLQCAIYMKHFILGTEWGLVKKLKNAGKVYNLVE